MWYSCITCTWNLQSGHAKRTKVNILWNVTFLTQERLSNSLLWTWNFIILSGFTHWYPFVECHILKRVISCHALKITAGGWDGIHLQTLQLCTMTTQIFRWQATHLQPSKSWAFYARYLLLFNPMSDLKKLVFIGSSDQVFVKKTHATTT